MYLSYYKLKAKPFQMSTDPAFLWLGEKHREALSILKYAIMENKGVLALTGDVGTGKTTLINALLKSLGKDTVTATIYDPRLEVIEFFNTIAAAFKLEGKFDGKGQFILKFMDFLIKTHEKNQKILLIIDEAQGINEDLLEEIRLLSNLEAEYTRLLNIFFVGQNEFVDILQKYENRALRQRVTIRYHIDPLTLNETAAYIKYRLVVAGTEAPIFDAGAIDEIYFFSGGYPRLINIMCDHALLSGFVREVQVINAKLIRECREELLVSKKTPERDFHYHDNDYRSLPNETMFSEPAEDPFIPVEDSHSYEDEQTVFSSWQPMSERAEPITPAKKSFYRSPVAMAIILVIGLTAGYFFYSNDKHTNESFARLAQQQAKKHLSATAESKNDTPSMAPATSETSDIPSRVETGNVGDSRFFVVKSPNSGLLKEAIPKETETPRVIFSTAGDSNVSPENSLETGSPKEMVPVTTKPVEKLPLLVPVTEKTPETIKTEAIKPVEKPEAGTSITTPVQAQKKTSERYQAKPEVKQVKESTSPKNAEVEKRSPVSPSVYSKKQATTLAATPLVKPPRERAISKKAVNRADEKMVSSSALAGKSEPSGKASFSPIDLNNRLKAFINEYCQIYEQKDLDKFSTFFALNAVEKGKPFRSWLSKYRQNFNRIDSIEYDIDMKRFATQEETGLVKVEGIFNVKAKLAGSQKWRKSSGEISMVLEADGNSFKIVQLDY